MPQIPLISLEAQPKSTVWIRQNKNVGAPKRFLLLLSNRRDTPKSSGTWRPCGTRPRKLTPQQVASTQPQPYCSFPASLLHWCFWLLLSGSYNLAWLPQSVLTFVSTLSLGCRFNLPFSLTGWQATFICNMLENELLCTADGTFPMLVRVFFTLSKQLLVVKYNSEATWTLGVEL